MIKNQIQASSVKGKIGELIEERQKIQNELENGHENKLALSLDALDSVIQELQTELDEYYNLVNGNFHFLKAKSLQDIPKVLIAARLAQKISQKQLATYLGIKEQQVQRYEATDYETASWPRIVEVATVLNIKLDFEKILIFKCSLELEIEGYSREDIHEANESIREEGLLII